MAGPFDLFEQFADVVEIETRAKPTEIAGLDDERRPVDARRRSHQAPAEGLVHYLPERPAGAPRLGLKLGSHVVVERQGSAHIMMLSREHHDVQGDDWVERRN